MAHNTGSHHIALVKTFSYYHPNVAVYLCCFWPSKRVQICIDDCYKIWENLVHLGSKLYCGINNNIVIVQKPFSKLGGAC